MGNDETGIEQITIKAILNSKIVKWIAALVLSTGTGAGAINVVREAYCQIEMNEGAIDYHHHPGVIFNDQTACYYKGRAIAEANNTGPFPEGGD